MAIGARILSDNLSGKTASVTFNALSGGTFDLGSQTIPFNYINSYPYGTYDLYFEEYDYTYSVTIPDPTPLQFTLQSQFTPGSIVAKYTLTSNVFLSEDVTTTFENILGVFNGSDITISTGVTISQGSKSGETIVTLSDDFNNWNGDCSFSQLSGVPSGSTYEIFNETFNKQGMTFLTVLTGETNISRINFVYGTLTAQTIDFGLANTDWYFWDVYPLTNNGYGYYFMKTDYSEMVAVFTDVYGNELYTFSGANNSLDYDDLDGVYNYIANPDNGELIYSDGVSAYTFTWDYTNYPYFEVDWDYFAVTSNNSFIIKVRNDSNEYKVYMINKGTSTLINTFDDNLVNIWHDLYQYANYIVRFTRNNDTGNNILSVDILELDGVTVRRTIDLSSSYYNGYDYAWWGDNKFTWVLWNWDNQSDPYRIFSYDGLTNTLDDQTFGSYTDYPERSWKYEDKFWPSDNGFSSMFILFYSSIGSQWYGYQMSKCEILYMLSGDTSFNRYNFVDTGSPKYLYPWGPTGNNLFTYCSTNGTDFQTFSITMSGVQITNISTIIEGNAVGQNNYVFGDKYIQQVWTNSNYDQLRMVLFNTYGEITDDMTLNLSGAFQRSDGSIGGIYYITDNSYGWWVNQDTDTFQLTTNYDIIYPDTYVSTDGYRQGIMGLKKQVAGNQYFRLLFRNAEISNEWQLPSNNGSHNIVIGRTNFLYSYNDNVDGYFNWILYDFNANASQSLTTPFSAVSFTSWAVKDRYLTRVNYGPNYVYYAISDSGYVTETSQGFGWDMINDYIWWD